MKDGGGAEIERNEVEGREKVTDMEERVRKGVQNVESVKD